MTALFVCLGVVIAAVLFAVSRRWIGFTAQRPADFAGKGPAFDLRHHLSGPIQCEGVIYGPLGRVASRFVADMQGTWDGNIGTLSEDFRYDSGLSQARCWTLQLGNDGGIRAQASDIVGDGTGVVTGPSVMLKYRIRLDPSAGGHVLDVTDWMYLMENGTIMNRSQFFKWGIKVAELVATMRPKQMGLSA
ncbi:DUF3833 domain-containing protein [Pseudorhodobacter ferrugineus]|uniref:DUF3833 domain-containing protein n=1 Tax=Pseudorhodobacter ferrugineus TaxID=77008 RepID=UPI0003B6B517|nr:DUF3833 domain-containing protein [Pseudorhodobacter ferrugineus]